MISLVDAEEGSRADKRFRAGGLHEPRRERITQELHSERRTDCNHLREGGRRRKTLPGGGGYQSNHRSQAQKLMKPSSKNYVKIVEWSDEDECYVGRCPGLIVGGVHGDDEAAVFKDLSIAVEEVLELHAQDKTKLPKPTAKKYSGNIPLRVSADLHRELALAAVDADRSLNQHLTSRLRERDDVARSLNQSLEEAWRALEKARQSLEETQTREVI